MGHAGSRALISRALALAQPEVPGLRMAQLQSTGALKPLADGQTMAEGEVVLLAQLLGLLTAFIGESLTLQMVRRIWPKLSLNASYFGEG
jgi:hypothetical protein